MKSGFAAHASFPLADHNAVIAPMCEHMMEHGAEVEAQTDEHTIRLDGSMAHFRRDGDMTFVDLTARTLEDLYFVRSAVASHILEFAGQSIDIEWAGDGNDLVRPPNFQILEIVKLRDLTPFTRRITFSTETPARFAALTALHLNLLIQHPELTTPQWPTLGANGLIQWADPDRRPSFRKYTVRNVDTVAGTLDIDFVMHADAGPGSEFAGHATLGMQVGVMGPGGGGLVNADWYLFAGDETALPAIARMLQHLPAHANGIALIEVADESEVQPLSNDTSVKIEWLYRNRPAGTGRSLAEAVRQIVIPDGDSAVYVWAGCEFDDFRSIRSYLREERKLKNHQHLVVAYWRKGKSEGAGD